MKKLQPNDRVVIIAKDDQFTGYTGTVKASKRRRKNNFRAGYTVYLIAIDGTIHELWFSENEVEKRGNRP